jgi:hypothetical protein
MGLFDFIFRRPNVTAAYRNDGYFKTLTAYRPHFSTWSGEIYESALVRAAIDARARHMSKLKVEFKGAAKPELVKRLKKRPNAFMSWSQFMYRTSTILDMHNTCVIVPCYDELMNVVGYYPILPTRCEIVERDGVPFLRYEFKNGEKAADFLSDCAILTKFQYRSDFFGETNGALTPTMKLIHVNEQGVEEAVQNGATYRFMAKVKNFSKVEDLKRERQRFNESNFKMEAENGGLLLFPNTYEDIKQINQTAYTVPKEELEEIRTTVYNYFGVNSDVLQSKAFGDSWAAFYEGVVEPFAIQFSETMTHAMFTEREQSLGALVMATSNRLQYMTTAEKLSVSADLADRGILTMNEIRDIWNLPPVDGGDVRIIRGEYYNADDKVQIIDEPAEEGDNGN